MHATKVGNPNMLISIPLHSAARWEAWEVFITRPVAWVGGGARTRNCERGGQTLLSFPMLCYHRRSVTQNWLGGGTQPSEAHKHFLKNFYFFLN